mmetsp:Transcript_20768/g.66715  ORF Transcript_20768/g.66715 Transcript_20768/m.66715 type:complete len:278 (-) Transcript_20768:2532-3365(-)
MAVVASNSESSVACPPSSAVPPQTEDSSAELASASSAHVSLSLSASRRATRSLESPKSLTLTRNDSVSSRLGDLRSACTTGGSLRCRNAMPRAVSISRRTRICGDRTSELVCSMSNSDPCGMNSVTSAGGAGQTPMSITTLGWRSDAIRPASRTKSSSCEMVMAPRSTLMATSVRRYLPLNTKPNPPVPSMRVSRSCWAPTNVPRAACASVDAAATSGEMPAPAPVPRPRPPFPSPARPSAVVAPTTRGSEARREGKALTQRAERQQVQQRTRMRTA